MTVRSGPGGRERRAFYTVHFGLTLALTLRYFGATFWWKGAAGLFVLAAWITYGLIYLTPTLLAGEAGFLARRLFRGRLAGGTTLFLVLCVPWATQMLLLADTFVHALFDMHMNGFVWNLLTTPGGFESMGLAGSNLAYFAAFGAALFGLHLACFRYVLGGRAPWLSAWLPAKRSRRLMLAGGLLALSGGQQLVYAFSYASGFTPVLVAAEGLPFYQRITLRHQIPGGLDVSRAMGSPGGATRLRYPLEPLVVDAPGERLNIVWLVAESLRADMLDPEIMPRTWTFAQRAQLFRNHHSGSNGTRMGMFTLFYGLPGGYWFSFLDSGTGPVLIDALRKQGYAFNIRTSARFTYPEFDRTIFSAVSRADMHEERQGASWERDRRNVRALSDWLASREPSAPFMAFQFFESSHAGYLFPPESEIRKPYLDEVNYAAMRLPEDVPLIRNRYINACHHLDSQIGALLEVLENRRLLERTIVVITGDHGEEFMESGHLGHNSDFSLQQVRTPLVLRVPGMAPSVSDRMTSHEDVVGTLLPLLGVRTPISSWTTGTPLFAQPPRDHVVVSDWYNVGFIDEAHVIRFPVKPEALEKRYVKDLSGHPVANIEGILEGQQDRFARLLKDLTRFKSK